MLQRAVLLVAMAGLSRPVPATCDLRSAAEILVSRVPIEGPWPGDPFFLHSVPRYLWPTYLSRYSNNSPEHTALSQTSVRGFFGQPLMADVISANNQKK